MAEEDFKLTSVSFKSNLKNARHQEDMVGNISLENTSGGATPGGPGGTLSLIPSVTPPNDLILVTDRLKSAKATKKLNKSTQTTHLRYNHRHQVESGSSYSNTRLLLPSPAAGFLKAFLYFFHRKQNLSENFSPKTPQRFFHLKSYSNTCLLLSSHAAGF